MILENLKLSNNFFFQFSFYLLFQKRLCFDFPFTWTSMSEIQRNVSDREMSTAPVMNLVQQQAKTSFCLCLRLDSSSDDHVLSQHHAGHTGRGEEDELHGPRWETHHGALGEGRAHHQPWDQPLRGLGQGGRRWSHLHPPGTACFFLSWLLQVCDCVSMIVFDCRVVNDLEHFTWDRRFFFAP